MKTKVFLIVMLLFMSTALCAQFFPQAGIESYLGANKLFLLSPWLGVRVSVSPQMSLLVKYYNHSLSYSYLANDSDEPIEVEMKANLSNLTTGFYAQKKNTYYFSAVSYMFGTDAYKALVFDGGVGTKLFGPISAEIGTYLLRESSVLWHPDEEERGISIYSVKGGLNLKVFKWLTLQGRGYYYLNSESVKAASYSVGLVITPAGPLFINFYYFKYSESADYKFKGDYFSIGINYYR